LRAGEVEVKREIEKERKREREHETKIKRDIEKERKLLVAPREFQLLKPGERWRGLRTSGRHEMRLDSSSRSAPPDLDRKRKCPDVCFMPPKTRLRPLVPPQVIGAEPHALALGPAAHFICVRALAVARDAQRQAVALLTWFSRRHYRHKDKQKESAFLRAGEVEVKREIEKERKREREKASRCTKRISAAKTGREVARATHQRTA
jgi:hypothetical protein